MFSQWCVRTYILLYVTSHFVPSWTIWHVFGQISPLRSPANSWWLSKALSLRFHDGLSKCKALSCLSNNFRAISQQCIGNFRALSHWFNLVCILWCLVSCLHLPCTWWCLCLLRQTSGVLNKTISHWDRSILLSFFSQVFGSGPEESLARTRSWMLGVWAP